MTETPIGGELVGPLKLHAVLTLSIYPQVHTVYPW